MTRPNHLVLLGQEVYIPSWSIVAITPANSIPIKRWVAEKKEKGLLIDATFGRRTRSVILFESGHILLTPSTPALVKRRFREGAIDFLLTGKTEGKKLSIE